MRAMPTNAYVAAERYVDKLQEELRRYGCDFEQIDSRLFLVKAEQEQLDALQVCWANAIWFDVQRTTIASVGDAAKILRDAGPYWGFYGEQFMRRATLIQKKLLKIKDKVLSFPPERLPKPRGAFTLLSEQEMLYAASCSRFYPNGDLPIEEDHENPPSRAYLKLQEALMLIGEWPDAGQKVIELGAAPGAWTYTLARLGAEVYSFDKAPLAEHVDAMSNVHHAQESAFGLEPQDWDVDWLFSDIICYPERLLNLIERWKIVGRCQRFVITVKFQGDTDFDAIDQFKQLDDSCIIHLHHNKHEVTWISHPALRDGLWSAKYLIPGK